MKRLKAPQFLSFSKPWQKVLLWAGLLAIPTIIALTHSHLDNDMWYLLSEGRYLTSHGFYYTDPLSMHEGLDVVVQNWLSAVIFWVVYTLFGAVGIFVVMFLMNFVICFLVYKICMTVSHGNRSLSLFLMLITDVLLSVEFIVTRPQLFSFINILLLIYLLELYIHKGRAKYLLGIPLISLLEINVHASYWVMLFLFMVPYLIDSFKSPKFHLQGYRKAPLFIVFFVSLLVGFCNPYGFKAMTFIFTSFTDSHMHDIISELHPLQFLDFTSTYSIINSFAVIIPLALYFSIGRSTLHVRYILLIAGTLALSLISNKGFSHYLLVAFWPLATIFPTPQVKSIHLPHKISRFFTQLRSPRYALARTSTTLIICAGLTITSIVMFIDVKDTLALTHPADPAMDLADQITGDYPATFYVSFNDGGYVEFRGYRPYITPQAELFIKANNHTADIFEEYYDLRQGNIEPLEFLTKYNFDFVLIGPTDTMFEASNLDILYDSIYDDTENGYQLFIRK